MPNPPIIESTQEDAAPGMRGVVVLFDTSDGEISAMCAVPNEADEETVISLVTEWAATWLSAYEDARQLSGTELDIT